jgi:hypothetical protein
MACLGIADAYQHRDVNIGWYPYRTTRATQIRTIPGAGLVVASVPSGAGLGVQSVRNPGKLSQVPPRAPAMAADGRPWVWCYQRAGTATGWIAAGDIEADQDAAKPPLKGTAGFDFEVGRTAPGPHSVSPCGHDVSGRPAADRVRIVKATDVYLRYSPGGTARAYLESGDKVELILVGAAEFVFVSVLSSSPGNPAGPGSRGWTSLTALEKP